MVKTIEADCRIRARGLKMTKTNEARQAVITACVKVMERFPLYQGALSRTVLDASASFPGLTSGARGRSMAGRTTFLAEEELASGVIEKGHTPL